MQIQNSVTSNVQQTNKVEKIGHSEKQYKADSIQDSYKNSMLDERANNILDKMLSESGFSTEEANDIRGKLIVMMTEIRVDSNGRIIEEAPKAPDMSKKSVIGRIDNLLHNLELNLDTGDFQEDNKRLYEVSIQLKTLYNAEYKPLNLTV